MRYLRLYSQDASFKADEINAGGTGSDVEAMVPGIVKTADLKKMYFKLKVIHALSISKRERIDYSDYKGLQKGDYRAAVRLPEENDILLQAMAEILRADRGAS